MTNVELQYYNVSMEDMASVEKSLKELADVVKSIKDSTVKVSGDSDTK